MSDSDIDVTVLVSSPEGDAVVDGPQIVVSTSGGPMQATADVDALPSGDAVQDQPQIVLVVSGPQGPAGPPGPWNAANLELQIGNAFAAISVEATVRASADEAYASLLTTVTARLGDAEAAITTEATTRATADSAMASLITTLTATVGANTAAITTEATVRADADSAMSSLITTLTATVGSNTAAITTEAIARADADSALSSLITTLTATVGTNTASITTEAIARVDGDSALASLITTLEVTVDSNTAAITTEATTRADADSALSSLITTLTATVGTNTASISTEAIARADGDSALASLITTLEVTVDANTAAITTEATTRADADSAMSSLITTLTATVDGNTASISTEATTRADADTALSSLITTLTSTVNGNTAAISTEATTRADADSAMSTLITNLTSTVGTNTAAISTEATTRADADSALSSLITTLEATVDDNTAAISTEASARASADSALATRATNIEAEITGARGGQASLSARFTQVDTARIDGDNALSSTLTTVSARANMGSASGTVELVAQAGPAGIAAMYAWRLVAGANQVGMRAVVTDGGVSRIEFNADQFRIYGGAGTGIPVFAIDGSTIVMTGDVRINGSLVIGTINGSVLPILPDLLPPSEIYPLIYQILYDTKGRITEATLASRISNIQGATAPSVGQVPYVGAITGVSNNEFWTWFSTSSTTRSFMAAADAAAARAAIGAAAAGGSPGSHVHDAADITTGTLAAARLATLVTAQVSQLVTKNAIDAQGRITGYTVAIRLAEIDGLAAGATGSIPYVSSYSAPNETWGWIVSSSIGRTVMAAANGAAIVSAIGAASASHAHAASDITSGTLADARLPVKTGALTGEYVLQQSLDVQGRVTGYTIAPRSNAIENLALGTVGGVPYVSSYSAPNETWGMIATTATGRSAMTAANGAALLALTGGAAASHVHSAADITSGTLAAARLATLVGSLVGEYILQQSLDAQGRVTGYAIAARANAIEALAIGTVGGIPYVSSYSAPNETWGMIASTATGRSILTAANGAAVLSTIGGAAASHVHSAADLTSGTVADARLSGTYSGFSLNLLGSNTIFGNTSTGSSSALGKTAYDLAQYRAHNGAQVGAIVFKAPTNLAAVMHRLEIDGFLYSPSESVKLVINGYRTTVWNQMQKVSLGTVDVQVRLALDASGNSCVILGDVGTVWSYPHFAITKAMFSHTVADSYCQNWTVAIETSLASYTQMTPTLSVSPTAALVNAANISEGTLPDARLTTKVGALVGQYILEQSVDAQGRVTGYTIAARANAIEALTIGVVGGIPYIASYSAPNESWGLITSTAIGRTVLQAADAAAVRTAIGSPATSHVHSAADITSGTLPDGRFSGTYTGVTSFGFAAATGDKLLLFNNTYGIGVESNTLTMWTASQLRIRTGGTSVSTGTERFLLDATGLSIVGTLDATGVISGNGSGLTTLNATNLSSGTIADARLTSKVTPLASEYLLKQSIDAQGRITGYTIASRANAIENLAGVAANRFPYVSSYSVPNETWGWMDIGTSGGVVPLLSGANTWSANQIYSSGGITYRLVLISASQVYIGTTSSHVVNMQVANVIRQTWDTTGSNVVGTFDASGAITSTNYVFSNAGAFAGSASTVILGNLSGGGTVYFRPNGYLTTTNQATINSAGNLVVAGTTTTGSHFYASGGGFGGTATVAILASTAAGTVYLRPNGIGSATGQFSVDSSGNVVASGRISTTGINIFTAASSSYSVLLSKPDDGIIMLIQRAGASVGSISVTASGTSYNITSDYRWKTRITPFANAERKLRSVKVYQGEVVGAPGDEIDFFIAHELQAHVPYAVSGKKDAVNDNRDPIYQQVDLSKVVPLHHAAIQVLFDEKDAIKQRIDSLEAQVALLKKKLAA